MRQPDPQWQAVAPDPASGTSSGTAAHVGVGEHHDEHHGEHHDVAEFALMGLLRDGPCHGYRLAAAFAPDGWLAPILRLKMSQMYAYLHKLERRGWLRARDATPGETPGAARPRRVFAPTAEGERAFDAWLAEPVGATRDIRLDFLVKLAFAAQRDRALAARLVVRQRDAIGARHAALVAERDSGEWAMSSTNASAASGTPSAADVLSPRQLALDARLHQTAAALAWLELLAATLART